MYLCVSQLKFKSMEKLLTVKEYADHVGLTAQAIYHKIKNNELKTVKQNGKVCIPTVIQRRNVDTMTLDEAKQLAKIVFEIRNRNIDDIIEFDVNKGYSVEIRVDENFLEYQNNGEFYHEVTRLDEYGINRERCTSFDIRRTFEFLKQCGFEL